MPQHAVNKDRGRFMYAARAILDLAESVGKSDLPSVAHLREQLLATCDETLADLADGRSSSTDVATQLKLLTDAIAKARTEFGLPNALADEKDAEK